MNRPTRPPLDQATGESQFPPVQMEELVAATAPHLQRTPLSALPSQPPALLHALEHATQSVRRACPAPQLVSTLRAAREAISSFLSRIDPAADEPMLDGAGEEKEGGREMGGRGAPRGEVDEMEEGMRDCSINSSSQGKRRKRNLPSEWPVGRVYGEDPATEDTIWRRRADAFDLVFQFHG